MAYPSHLASIYAGPCQPCVTTCGSTTKQIHKPTPPSLSVLTCRWQDLSYHTRHRHMHNNHKYAGPQTLQSQVWSAYITSTSCSALCKKPFPSDPSSTRLSAKTLVAHCSRPPALYVVNSFGLRLLHTISAGIPPHIQYVLSQIAENQMAVSIVLPAFSDPPT
jgi:hypothetical protein